MTFELGTYVKGDRVRNVGTQTQAVQAVWEGFARPDSLSAADLDYRDLQAQAKALGIPANQSKDALTQAIADHEGPALFDAVETENASPETPDSDA